MDRMNQYSLYLKLAESEELVLMKEITCVICGKKIKGSGNSCWPIFNEEEYRCCDECNMTVIVPERIWEAQQAQTLKDNKLENNGCY